DPEPNVRTVRWRLAMGRYRLRDRTGIASTPSHGLKRFERFHAVQVCTNYLICQLLYGRSWWCDWNFLGPSGTSRNALKLGSGPRGPRFKSGRPDQILNYLQYGATPIVASWVADGCQPRIALER